MSWVVTWLFAVLALASGALSVPARHHLSIVGATSSLAYLRRAVSAFEGAHPGYTVSLSGGGSVAGLVEVSQGRADVGVSDIPPRADWTGGRPLSGFSLGRLPILFITHPGTGVQAVSGPMLKAILSGRMTGWQQVGGVPTPIIVFTRPLASGARHVVQTAVLGPSSMTRWAITELSNGAMIAAVRETPGSLGFIESSMAPQGVTVLDIAGVHFDAQHPGNWPYMTHPTLYVRPGAAEIVKDLARYVASRPYRSQFGLLGATS